ncbi:MAG: HD domain-containing phosphohydrolase [Dehalococcoidia bacterium]
MDRPKSKLRILLVEDSSDDAYLLERELVRLGFELDLERVETEAGMVSALRSGKWDLVLSDYSLPSFNAPAALEVLKKQGLDIPFVIVSGTVGEDTAVSSLKAGAADFIVKGKFARLGPAIERELAEADQRRARRAAEASWAESERRFELAFQASPSPMAVLDDQYRFAEVNRRFTALFGLEPKVVCGKTPSELGLWTSEQDPLLLAEQMEEGGTVPGVETTLVCPDGRKVVGLLSAVAVELRGARCILASFLDITERKHAELAVEQSRDELAHAYESTLQGWAKALELRDAETEGHSQRVTDLTVTMARLAGIAGDELVHIRRGALLHDIGKMGVPDSILLKPGPLTDDEWVVMRMHPTFAYEMLQSIEFLRPALEVPLCHHERWDGGGYPRGLAGEMIPLAARLFAVVDVWDALSSPRPYKPAWDQDRVFHHVRSLRGSHFDPLAVDIFEHAMAHRRAA